MKFVGFKKQRHSCHDFKFELTSVLMKTPPYIGILTEVNSSTFAAVKKTQYW